MVFSCYCRSLIHHTHIQLNTQLSQLSIRVSLLTIKRRQFFFVLNINILSSSLRFHDHEQIFEILQKFWSLYRIHIYFFVEIGFICGKNGLLRMESNLSEERCFAHNYYSNFRYNHEKKSLNQVSPRVYGRNTLRLKIFEIPPYFW